MWRMGKVRRVALLSAISASLCLFFAASADAFIYWSNTGLMGGGNTIGRANTDGTNVDESFISIPGHATICGVAVDASHIYWVSETGGPGPREGEIGRANLDGTGVNPDFIQNALHPCGIAVNATHIYWGNDHAIGRANINGTNVNQSFIPSTLGYVFGIGINDTHLFWANSAGLTANRSIGRATLDGLTVDPNFISTDGEVPNGLAVTNTYVYWGGVYGGKIGRASVDGGGMTNSFISDIGGDACGLATNAANLYWSDWTSTQIGRAPIGGGAPESNFIELGGTDQPCGVAVDARSPTTPPPNSGDKTPPNTTITAAPKRTLRIPRGVQSVKVHFRYKSSEPNSTFECKIDGHPFKACGRTRTVRVGLGRHKFRVRAIDLSGNVDPTPAARRFKVIHFAN